MSEEWRDIPGYDGYQASTSGNIRNCSTGKVITNYQKPRYKRIEKRNTDGRVIEHYKSVVLRVNNRSVTKLVHRLVALAFLGEPRSRDNVVNHKNGMKRDNRIENLEYLTHRENTQHYHDVIKGLCVFVELTVDEYIDLENKTFLANMGIDKYIRSRIWPA